MRSLIIGLGLVAGLSFAYHAYHAQSATNEALDHAIQYCILSSKINSKDECETNQINRRVTAQTKLTWRSSSESALLQDTGGEFVDLSTGDVVPPNLSGLSEGQKKVFEAWKLKAKSDLKERDNRAKKDAVLPFLVLGAVLVVSGYLLLLVAPPLWRFLLNRLADVASALKGEKF